MTVSQKINEFSYVAGGDLSSNQFRLMTQETDGDVVAATSATAALSPIVGVLLNKPAAQGRAAAVAGIGSIVKVEAGAEIAVGDAIRAVTGGRGSATVVAGDWIGGYAVSVAGGSGSLFMMSVQPGRFAGTA